MIYFIDHHDSFSLNLLNWIQAVDLRGEVKRVDCFDLSQMQFAMSGNIPLIISPGPKAPGDYPLTMKLLETVLGKAPILGICLGHQMLAATCGAKLKRVKNAMHGSTERVNISDHIFKEYFAQYKNSTNGVQLTAYHSLTIDPQTIPPQKIEIIALTEQGEVAGCKSRDLNYNYWSWQHHPESFLAQNSNFIREHFIDIVNDYRSDK